MFDLTVTNNYFTSFTVDNGNRLYDPGHTYPFPNLSGNHTIQIYGMGDVLILDIGDKKLPQYTNPKIPWTESTWGGLVRYGGEDAYFRYEGNGKISIVIDSFGSLAVHFEQGGMKISLDEMTVS
jgi:hypothetical protein